MGYATCNVRDRRLRGRMEKVTFQKFLNLRLTDEGILRKKKSRNQGTSPAGSRTRTN